MNYKNLITGLKIIAEKVGEDEFIGGADHDVIWLCPDEVEFTIDEKKALRELGFREGEYGWECGV